MNGRSRTLIFAIMAVPAVSGWPLEHFPAEVLPGARWVWLGYAVLVHLALWRLAGAPTYGMLLALAALASLPVVYGGALVAFLRFAAGWSVAGPEAYSAHYLSLCLTMLTVIPLALGLVSLVPLQQIESRLLRNRDGVTALEKRFLMALRVFNHVVYAVLPAILDVLREERLLRATPSASWRSSAGRLRAELVQVALEAICAAVQYLPLWAVEIARLPTRGKTKERTKR